ncbi:MAG: GIY-YIG nuclease family protein [Pseudomonadota bacterium]
MQSVFFVYILRCADGSYYVGSHRGDDLSVRVAEHNSGKYPNAWTFKRRPVELMWSDCWPEAEPAIAAEQQIKKWSRAKKAALIRGEIGELKRLAQSRTSPADPKKKKTLG